MDSITLPKVSFYLREKKDQEVNVGALYMRIYYNGIYSEISLKKQIDFSLWSKKTGSPKGNSQYSKEIKLFIDLLEAKVLKHFRYLIDNQMPVSSVILKRMLLGKQKSQKSLLETFEYHNKRIRQLANKEYAPATIERYETTMGHLKRFLKSEYNMEDIPLSDLNYEFITSFDKYFRLERGCGHNTTVKYLRNFKKIIYLAIKMNWLDKDPFSQYSLRTKTVERGFLVQDEINGIANYKFHNQRLQLVADLFLFACYTGLAYIDIKNLKADAIKIGIDGNQWLSIQRHKTGTISNIPLLPPALKIIEKFENHPETSSSGKLLPILTNQKMNAYLKEIADLCRINKNLTFHLARHTFATTITLANGISMEAVSKMLGHKSLSTTQVYAKIVESQISKEMQELRKKFTSPQPSSPKNQTTK